MTADRTQHWPSDRLQDFSEEYYRIENRIQALEIERSKRRVKRVKKWHDGIIAVGTGYGCVVQGAHDRFVITATHCLPELPPATPVGLTEDAVIPLFWDLLAARNVPLQHLTLLTQYPASWC